MSKVICEICGTAYPDTATECPICGFPRSKISVDLDDLQLPELDNAAPPAADKVKGGRFSNKNVKKRQEEDQEESYYQDEDPDDDDDEHRGPGKGLKIFVSLLAVGVIAVGAYIGYRFWAGSSAYDETKPVVTAPAATDAVTDPMAETTAPTVAGIPCTDLLVSDTEVEMQAAGRGWLLGYSVSPEDTTDVVTFTSSDESVAKVSESGRITSVGPGTATITITCGDIVRECVVNCSFDDGVPTEGTDPTGETEQTQPTEVVSNKGFQLDRTDVTLFKKGESFTFGARMDGDVLSKSEVQWESSDDKVVTVENGTVTAVAAGKATITATYNGEKKECVVRCRFEEDAGAPEDQYTDNNWKLSNSDVTLIIGETFTLTLKNDAGEIANVTWNSSNYGVVTMDGNDITGNLTGMTDLTATIGGQTYTCIVRVIPHR